MLPLDGAEGEAKGYALVLTMEALSGMLTEATFGSGVGSIYAGEDPPASEGHIFILLDVAIWTPTDGYYERMGRFVEEIKASLRRKGSRISCTLASDVTGRTRRARGRELSFLRRCVRS